ncbi:EamA family transporter RarD [Roseiconus nitratireducens]|uniref:EamA family transporter RarD n=1 Tax=Roseiconus nitratireducens TaxID=2605748 RepID=A0A5M6DF77_9BACT|nr:EamA family transporter RarD [Roseiconus nitratireducens]KAA5546214.1 EamA family transporter RarD [Roseiconus nitratireducens]
MSASTRFGAMLAIAAQVLWGLFPIYWNLLGQMATTHLVAHRILWAFVFSLLIAAVRFFFSDVSRRAALLAALRDRRTWITYGTAGALVATNWLAFLWAVNHDRVLFSSLGYYINPLFNVLLGVLVLGERLSGLRWFAITLAAVGVTVMALAGGEVPWVSFVMASSFALYALVKKKAKLDALNGLLIETTVLLLPTLVFLACVQPAGSGVFGGVDATTKGLLVFGGLLTITPLALFAGAAHRAPLSLLGILQYIGPTLQFAVGAFYFGEPLSTAALIGFAFVWTGVAVFLLPRRSIDARWQRAELVAGRANAKRG